MKQTLLWISSFVTKLVAAKMMFKKTLLIV